MAALLLRDLEYAGRAIRRSPGYAAVVVASLALGIAGTTTVFSVMNPYLLRELPFGDSDRLVQLAQVNPQTMTDWIDQRLSLAQYEDWKARSRAFEDMAAYSYRQRNLTGDEGAERVMTGLVTGNLFSVLAVQAVVGRTLTPEDARPNADHVVVLGHGLWSRRYGADSGVIGRPVHIDGVAHTVVGVTPPDFNFPWNEVKMWTPVAVEEALGSRTLFSHIPVGRLAPGWTAELAREELAGIQRELSIEYPEVDGRFPGVTVRPLREALNWSYDTIVLLFTLLLSVIVAVLLVACVNVAALTMARNTARVPEIAVRTALGAGRARLVRQFLIESLVLALAGGVVGLWLAHAAVSVIGARLSESWYRVGTATIDGRVLLFSAVLTLVTPLLFGLLPALTAARARPSDALKVCGRGAGVGRVTVRGRQSLVVAQVALAVVLLTAAGLMIRSFHNVQRVELGFQAGRLLTIELSPPVHDYPEPEAVEAYYERAAGALTGLAGVRAVASTWLLPLNHENITFQFTVPQDAGRPREEWPVALQARTGAGYFDAMGIPFVAGRDFGSSDSADAPPVAIVNRTLAEWYWPSESPLDQTLLLAMGREPVAATVVGVVEDVRHIGLTGDLRPQVHLPLTQAPARRRFVVVSTAGEPTALAAAVRDALAAVDRDLPATIRPMRDIVRENDFQWRIGSAALAAFGAMGLLLAALGIYGLIAYSVARRRRELGIRLALGATARMVRRQVMTEGLRLTGIGLAAGAVLSLAMGRLLASQLYGVGPIDPLILLLVLLLFILVAAAACARPAATAAALAPHDLLRDE